MQLLPQGALPERFLSDFVDRKTALGALTVRHVG